QPRTAHPYTATTVTIRFVPAPAVIQETPHRGVSTGASPGPAMEKDRRPRTPPGWLTQRRNHVETPRWGVSTGASACADGGWHEPPGGASPQARRHAPMVDDMPPRWGISVGASACAGG